MQFRILGALACLCAAGCVRELRASSRADAAGGNFTLLFPGSPDDALGWLAEQLQAKGDRFLTLYGRPDRQIAVFRGTRERVSLPGQGYWGPKGTLTGKDLRVGSIFYAYASPASDQWTYVALLGKPTLNDHALCSSEDLTWRLPCSPVSVPKGWTDTLAATGKEEAEVIRGLLAELAVKHRTDTTAVAGPPLWPPANTPAPPGWIEDPQADCYWDYQTGSHFTHRVCPAQDVTDTEDREHKALFTKPYWSRAGQDGAAGTLDRLAGGN